ITVALCTIFFVLNTDIKLSVVLISGELVGLLFLQYKYKIIRMVVFTKLKSIFTLSMFSLVATILYTLTLSILIYALNYFIFLPKDIASFAIAFSLLKYSSLILTPFMQLITPVVAPLKNRKNELQKIFYKNFIIILIIGIITGCLIHFSSHIIIE